MWGNERTGLLRKQALKIQDPTQQYRDIYWNNICPWGGNDNQVSQGSCYPETRGTKSRCIQIHQIYLSTQIQKLNFPQWEYQSGVQMVVTASIGTVRWLSKVEVTEQKQLHQDQRRWERPQASQCHKGGEIRPTLEQLPSVTLPSGLLQVLIS